MENASEDELRSVEDDMSSELNSLDYDSEDYLDLDLQRIDVVNTIASRFPINLPKREHATIARDAICRAVWECNTLIVGMTATPKSLTKLNCRIYRMPIDESKLRQYESKEIIPYRSLPQLLQQLPKSNSF